MNVSTKNDQADQASTPLSQARINQLSATSAQPSHAVARVVAVCPACKTTLSVRRAYVGNAVKCKQCDHVFTVPGDVDTPPGPDGARAPVASATEDSQAESGSQRAGTGDKAGADSIRPLARPLQHASSGVRFAPGPARMN